MNGPEKIPIIPFFVTKWEGLDGSIYIICANKNSFPNSIPSKFTFCETNK